VYRFLGMTVTSLLRSSLSFTLDQFGPGRSLTSPHDSLSWEITPVALMKAITDPDPAAAKRAFDAMMQMKKIDITAIEAAHRG
jgi:hypothetical protein